MNIVNPQWTDTSNTQITAMVDGAQSTFTALPGLGLYDQLLASGAPIAASTVPAPPASCAVTPRQARLALLGAGLLDTVNTAINAAGGATLVTWEYASTIDRNDPLITQLGQVLNLTSAQIDALFATASTL